MIKSLTAFAWCVVYVEYLLQCKVYNVKIHHYEKSTLQNYPIKLKSCARRENLLTIYI